MFRMASLLLLQCCFVQSKQCNQNNPENWTQHESVSCQEDTHMAHISSKFFPCQKVLRNCEQDSVKCPMIPSIRPLLVRHQWTCAADWDPTVPRVGGDYSATAPLTVLTAETSSQAHCPHLKPQQEAVQRHCGCNVLPTYQRLENMTPCGEWSWWPPPSQETMNIHRPPCRVKPLKATQFQWIHAFSKHVKSTGEVPNKTHAAREGMIIQFTPEAITPVLQFKPSHRQQGRGDLRVSGLTNFIVLGDCGGGSEACTWLKKHVLENFFHRTRNFVDTDHSHRFSAESSNQSFILRFSSDYLLTLPGLVWTKSRMWRFFVRKYVETVPSLCKAVAERSQHWNRNNWRADVHLRFSALDSLWQYFDWCTSCAKKCEIKKQQRSTSDLRELWHTSLTYMRRISSGDVYCLMGLGLGLFLSFGLQGHNDKQISIARAPSSIQNIFSKINSKFLQTIESGNRRVWVRKEQMTQTTQSYPEIMLGCIPRKTTDCA